MLASAFPPPPLGPYRDLATTIHRQRLVVEGVPSAAVDDTAICSYLDRLADVTGMVVLSGPVTHRSDKFGWAGWVHWETSGAHFYAWEEPMLFFSVDIYTCKAFDPIDVVRFTKDTFHASEIVAKSL